MSILSSFENLPQNLIHIAKRGGYYVGSKLYGAINAMYEKQIGVAPPGGASILFFPHDHTNHGGIAIPRNNVYTFDYMYDYNGWDLALTDADVWYRRDVGDDGIVCPDTAPPTAPGVANIAAYCTPGIDSTKTNVNGYPCKWEAKVLVYNTYLAATDFRFYNRTTQSYSSVQTTGALNNFNWLSFSSDSADEGIPCRGGVWNFLDLEARWAGVGGQSVEVHSIVISETRRSSMPVSAGTYKYNAAVKP